MLPLRQFRDGVEEGLDDRGEDTADGEEEAADGGLEVTNSSNPSLRGTE